MKTLLLLTLALPLLAYADCEKCAVENAILLPRPLLPDWPLELIDIKPQSYKRNKNSEYCTRPEEMLDTIVFHHSETTPEKTPVDINQYHLDRGWYMGGYSYVVNSPYQGGSLPSVGVTEGRPIDLVGSHAGSEVYVPMSEAQKEMWDSGRILCGKEGGTFKVDPLQVRGETIKANVTSLGIVVIGNYVRYSRQNPAGYPRNKPRYPTEKTQDMLARLSCQLQKKYPNIKTLRWHGYYHPTDCPGTIQKFMDQIRTKARGYGCEFN